MGMRHRAMGRKQSKNQRYDAYPLDHGLILLTPAAGGSILFIVYPPVKTDGDWSAIEDAEGLERTPDALAGIAYQLWLWKT